MNIGQASEASGVSAKMIRYYESIGLLPEAERKTSNYRTYSTPDIHRLSFVRRARDLGFSMEQIKDLLSLWSDQSRSNAEVRAVARTHLKELEAQAAKLEDMVQTLRRLIGSCQRGKRPDCPIIAELGGGVLEVSPSRKVNGTPRNGRC